MNIDHNKKYAELLSQLDQRKGSVLIFAKTKHGTQRMAKNLTNDGFKSDALNGNLNQNKRDKVMNNFRLKKFKVLVATDIASRGLDVNHIEHVINYDLPQVAEDYVHRIGRTGRAGLKGSTICFISPEEQQLWDQIDYLLNPKTAKKPSSSSKNTRSVRKRSNGQNQSARPSRSFSSSNGPRRSSQGNNGSKPFRGNSARRADGNTDLRPSRSSRPKRNSEGNNGSKPFRGNSARRADGNTDSRHLRDVDGNTDTRSYRGSSPRRNSQGKNGSRPFRTGSPKRNSDGNANSRSSRRINGNTDSRPSRSSASKRTVNGNTFSKPIRGSGQRRNTTGSRTKTLGLRQGSRR